MTHGSLPRWRWTGVPGDPGAALARGALIAVRPRAGGATTLPEIPTASASGLRPLSNLEDVGDTTATLRAGGRADGDQRSRLYAAPIGPVAPSTVEDGYPAA